VTNAGSLDNLNLTRSDPLMTAHFVTKRRVEFSDTDMAGIIHFASYYRYMEEAEHQFFRSLGLSVMQKHDEQTILGWPRVSANCSFAAPARFEDVLEIRITVERKGVKSLTMRYEFFLNEDDEEKQIATGRMKIACCLCRHDQPLESIPIPAEIDKLIPVSEDGSES
jgi:YbgC/YbaW family acyl-CoA thioester hydrolase